jgi:hypothetical protein
MPNSNHFQVALSKLETFSVDKPGSGKSTPPLFTAGIESLFSSHNVDKFEKNGLFVDIFYDKKAKKFQMRCLLNNRFNESWGTFQEDKITGFQRDLDIYLTSDSATRPWLQ